MASERQGVSTALQPNWNDVSLISRDVAERMARQSRATGWPQASAEDCTDDDGQYYGSWVALYRHPSVPLLIYWSGYGNAILRMDVEGVPTGPHFSAYIGATGISAEGGNGANEVSIGSYAQGIYELMQPRTEEDER